MRHTYLFEEARWKVEGVYVNADGSRCPIVGERMIAHDNTRWRLDGTMRLHENPNSEQRNSFDIAPWQDETKPTTWNSTSHELGESSGKFLAVEDAILSEYKSKDGVFSGFECLIELDEETYTGAGLLMRDGETFGSWQVTLTKSLS